MITIHAARHRDLGAAAAPRTHDSLREGVRLGLVVATITWLWVAAIDALAGAPFRTASVLGGMAMFTVVHYLLNIAYAVSIIALVHSAVRAPSLIFGIGFGFLMLEFAFALLSAMLSRSALGELAWVRIFGGSLIGAVIAFVIVARRHPLAELLRQAEEET